MCRLIGIVGPLGHGKTTAAQMLTTDGYVRLRMADVLKEMLKTLGLTHEQVDGDQKEVPADLLGGKTPRWAMQSLGTEWGRVCIGEDIWVRAMQQRLVTIWCKDPDAKVVIDDIRFPNEVEMVLGNGGEVWRVVDPRKTEDMSFWERVKRILGLSKVHPSEYYWKRIIPHADLINDGSFDELAYRLKIAIAECDQRERQENGGQSIRETTQMSIPATYHFLTQASPI